MATVNNGAYTPTPQTLDVIVYRDDADVLHADSGPEYLVAARGTVIGRETAKVIERGNLLRNGVERWYRVELADGSRHMVIGEGS